MHLIFPLVLMHINLSVICSDSQELAGRTMEFTFDVSQTPLIGRRILLKTDAEANQSFSVSAVAANRGNNGQSATAYLTQNPLSGTPNSPRRSASLSPADTAPLSGWKRPWVSQSRVRECLVNLLTTCGQRVGLPKSPSVSIRLKNKFTCALEMYYSKPTSSGSPIRRQMHSI